LFAGFGLTVACAASFDCEKAATTIEKTICENPTLSSADAEMAILYRHVQIIDSSVVADQRSWAENTSPYRGPWYIPTKRPLGPR
jgi:uncharacterized protein